jgi:hypothetical protein
MGGGAKTFVIAGAVCFILFVSIIIIIIITNSYKAAALFSAQLEATLASS